MKSVLLVVSSFALALAGPDGHYHCPKGFDLQQKKDGAVCVKEISKRVFYACPDGWKKMKKGGTFECKLRTVVEPTVFCQDPFELVDGKCVRMIEREPEMRCPKNFNNNDGTCEKKTFEDAALRCPKGQELLAGGKCLEKEELDVSYRCRGGGELTDDNMCKTKKVTNAPRRCPEGFRNVDGICTRRIEEDLEVTCSKGTVDPSDDDFCVGRTITDPQRICPRPGIEEDNMCFKRELEMKIPQCEEGWEVVHRSDRVVCKKCEDHEDRKCVYDPPHYVCPAGFESTGDAKDAMCVKKIPIDFKYVCAAAQGTLQEVGGQAKCVKPFRIPSKKSCADGFKRMGDKCVKIETTDFEYFCPKGTTGPTADNKCVSEELTPATPFCPEGQLVGDKCIVEKITRAEYFCANPDAELKGRRCVTVETADMIAFCRKNFDLIDGTCKRTIMRLPKRRCPEGFTKTRELCLKVTIQPATPSCKPNFVLDDNMCKRRIVKEPTFHKGGDHDDDHHDDE